MSTKDVVVIVRTGPSLEDQFGDLCRRAESLGLGEDRISELLMKDEDTSDPFRSLREVVRLIDAGTPLESAMAAVEAAPPACGKSLGL